jgi:hypothetical protein
LGNPKTRTFAELLIDAEEDPNLRAMLVGMLREGGLRFSRPIGRGNPAPHGEPAVQLTRSAVAR